MPKKIDLTGQKFGRLTVISRENNSKPWKCQCECGNVTYVKTAKLNNGHTRSCGCLKREMYRGMKKHNLSRTSHYRAWKNLKQRCENPNHTGYKNYGGRGIKLCKEWRDYKVFYDWSIENGYKEGLTLERENNNGDYSPENCKWASRLEQAQNRRTNVFTVDLVKQVRKDWKHLQNTITISEYARRINVNKHTLRLVLIREIWKNID